MHAPIAKDMTTGVHSRFVQQLEADGAREGGEVAHSCASLRGEFSYVLLWAPDTRFLDK